MNVLFGVNIVNIMYNLQEPVGHRERQIFYSEIPTRSLPLTLASEPNQYRLIIIIYM